MSGRLWIADVRDPLMNYFLPAGFFIGAQPSSFGFFLQAAFVGFFAFTWLAADSCSVFEVGAAIVGKLVAARKPSAAMIAVKLRMVDVLFGSFRVAGADS
ncbi:MAG: hypothetical protein EXR03_04450 [Pseudolabrys sp.]|nr:hypothetical protein [Pseudolabrys sp.]MSP32059.1 hypothetical protein [Pseudolabrys sp.]